MTGLELIYQVMHTPKSSKHMKDIVVKLDPSKVFDTVEWPFILHVMELLAFPSHLITLIHKCLTSTSLVVRYNHTKIVYFHPLRGLHQWDPLSSFLFILCIKGLSTMIKHSHINNRWQALIIKKQMSNIIHLAFVDDILLFYQGTNDGNAQFLRGLDQFCSIPSQKINFNKSQIIFSIYATQHFKDSTYASLIMTSMGEIGTYLGIPFTQSRQQCLLYKPTLQKLKFRVNFWHHKLLSKVGRLIMIQSVLQAKPLHLM